MIPNNHTATSPLLHWCLGCLCLLFLFSGRAHAQPKPTKRSKAPAKKPSKKAQKKLIYVYRDGTFIGLSLRYNLAFSTELLVNAAHKLQWLRIKANGVTIILLPQGGAMLDRVRLQDTYRLTFQGQGRLATIGPHKCLYDLNGRLKQLGKMVFAYDPAGRLASFSGIKLKYRGDQKLDAIGKLKLTYRAEGRINAIGGVKFTYRADGRIENIGKLKLQYHPLRNLIYKCKGKEPRADVRLHWTTLGVYRLLRKK